MISPKIQVHLRISQRKWLIDGSAISHFVSTVWKSLGKRKDISLPRETEVTLALLNNKRMQWYNAAFRSKDYPTDVLSFPVNEITQEQRHYLGDMLISVEKAAEQARAKRHSLDRELQILVLHGILHLLGYDHETDSGEMEQLEMKVRKIVLNDSRWARPARTLTARAR